MKLHIWLFTLLSFVGLLTAQSQVPDYWNSMIGSAFTDNGAYTVLQQICDEAGGRLTGSEQNVKAQHILMQHLQKARLNARLERFEMPGWKRGADVVRMVQPASRTLRAVALGYVDKTPAFKAPLIYGFSGQKRILDSLDVKGKIVLVGFEKPKSGPKPFRAQVIRFAAKNGARAVLFINKKIGGLCLAGTSSFQGVPAPIPAFSLTREEGLWLKRLLKAGQTVVLEMEVRSYCTNVKTANVVLTLPGTVPDKIVLGAHFDSWDLGQGSIDNGLGTAILFEVARLIKKYRLRNYYTLEFVWFNGEELGLWGSKKYVEMHQNESIIAMLNMDMTGRPTGFNVMGFTEFLPFFERLLPFLGGFNLDRGIVNSPWTNSDHMPFMLRGIPVITLTAHLDKEQVNYYHSFGDTFDKVRSDYLAQASGLIAILATELASDRSLHLQPKSKESLKKMLEHYHLDEILKKENEWPFQE